jgi:hypothetical protein
VWFEMKEIKQRIMRRHTHTVNCKSVFKYICENLDADLNSPQCRKIQAHLGQCKDCTLYLKSLKKTINLYRVYPVPTFSASSHKTLLKAIMMRSK